MSYWPWWWCGLFRWRRGFCDGRSGISGTDYRAKGGHCHQCGLGRRCAAGNAAGVGAVQCEKQLFFVTGRFAEKFPELVQQIADAGHEIGNHGYKHPHPDQLSVAQNEKDITQSEAILKNLVGVKPTLYAPPYGEHGQTCLQAAENCGYTTILWTADTVDWEEPAPSHDTLVQRVTGDKLTSGAIILMHPKAHTAEALPDIIGTIKAKGYQCVKVSEVL